MEKDRIVFKGSHPDSLYRVAADSGDTRNKMTKILYMLRWPAALITVCIALALFVYFLMPDSMNAAVDNLNATYWDPTVVGVNNQLIADKSETKTKSNSINSQTQGMKTPEIDFYDTENNKNYDITAIIDTITETDPKRVLPVAPIFPSHITPEVQYGNERADKEKTRTPKLLEGANTLPEDSTLKPHITQKPEKPLEIYFKDVSTTSSTTEAITRAETVNDFTNHDEKQTTKKYHSSIYKEFAEPTNTGHQEINILPELPPEVQEFYSRQPVKPNLNFTSGHSKLFGVSIEDAEKVKVTTQNSAYNTRVSPTLPTWRDGDDTTTKKYPTNVNYEVPQCRSTRQHLCRGVLPYDLAGTPATIGGAEISTLMSQIEYLVATNCSDRVRHFVCALLEPECSPPPYPAKMPCYNLCKAILDSCDGLIPRELHPAFKCQYYSKTNCVGAKAPCYPREMTCGDGSCVPRDWICDGTQDCPNGEDEASCVQCEKSEYRCPSGGCIQKRWLCDGYADCSNGEDEEEDICGGRGAHVIAGEVREPGEESAGSAPAPAVRRPNRVPNSHARAGDLHILGENESSKELLVTSDSSNPYKRNFTRRPSLSRLSPYNRHLNHPIQTKPNRTTTQTPKIQNNHENEKTTQKYNDDESGEDVNVGDLGFFEDLKKEPKEHAAKNVVPQPSLMPQAKHSAEKDSPKSSPSRLDKSISRLERVIDGAALLKKAEADAKLDKEHAEPEDSPEALNSTRRENISVRTRGSISAHVSPCPSGELRCVDGRCITLAQLCDGTIDCTDHADEDNCYT